MGIRLMIADDHVAIRAGISSLIQGTEIELVCQAETCAQTIKLASVSQPDVLLLDVRLGDEDGLTALEQIKREHPGLAVLIFSACDEVKTMAHARKLGAIGYIPKSVTRDEFLKSIRRAANGQNVWTPHQLRQVVSRAAMEAVACEDRNPLSPREVMVLQKIVEGRSNEAISEELEIDIETVKQHVKHILKKLHLVDRTQAALFAVRSEFTPQPSPVVSQN